MSSPMTEVPKPETRPKLPEGWRWVRLRDICQQDRKVIANIDQRIGKPYLSLEHIESGTGEIRKTPQGKTEDEGKSATFAFDERHVLYGKLRPYLNKVALPSFAGRCTTEIVPLLPSEEVDRGFLAWLLRRPETVHYAMQGKTGSRMPRADMNHLLSALVPLPPLETQRRIAAILTEQMGAVEKARKAAEEGLEAARKLAGAYTVASFRGPKVADWDRVPLADISTFLPAKSIASDGDTEVLAITTACLSESGFRPKGIKTARMWANDAREATVSPGEILIARSNTPELVGRVAVYPGGYPNLVASDLTIRIKATGADPAYLGAYLSSLYLSGYWKERAGGASGSMKKITRGQLQDERIPLPNLETQHRIVAELNAKLKATQALIHSLEAQLEAIRALPAAILRRAFSGEL